MQADSVEVQRSNRAETFKFCDIAKLVCNDSLQSIDFPTDIIINDDAWLQFNKIISIQDIQNICTIVLKDAIINKLSVDTNKVKLQNVCLSVFLSNDNELKMLNKKFRNIDKTTNILSFNAGKEIENLSSPSILLGDIFMSYQTLAKEALEQNKSFKNHFIHILLHGLLHLLGYDHTYDDDAKIMENKEIEILANYFQIHNPYILI